MPSVSQKQHNLMAACAHGAGYAECPPARVATEFARADAGKSTKDLPLHSPGGLVQHGSYMGHSS